MSGRKDIIGKLIQNFLKTELLMVVGNLLFLDELIDHQMEVLPCYVNLELVVRASDLVRLFWWLNTAFLPQLEMMIDLSVQEITSLLTIHVQVCSCK